MEGKKGKATIKTGGAGKFLCVTLLKVKTLLTHVDFVTLKSKVNLQWEGFFFFHYLG